MVLTSHKLEDLVALLRENKVCFERERVTPLLLKADEVIMYLESNKLLDLANIQIITTVSQHRNYGPQISKLLGQLSQDFPKQIYLKTRVSKVQVNIAHKDIAICA